MNRYFDSYGSDTRRIQYAGSETDGFSVDYKVIEFSLAKLQLRAHFKKGHILNPV